MKSAALLSHGHICTLKKNGQLMTHHSGLIPSYDEGICTRIEECRQPTSPSVIYKIEVIDKDNGKATRNNVLWERKKEFLFHDL